MAGLSPPSLPTVGSPPLATMYKEMSPPGVSSVRRLNRPSALVRACASCLGSPALAAHKVMVDPATGPPPAWTRPSMLTAAAGTHVEPSSPLANSIAAIWFLPILNMGTLPALGFTFGFLAPSCRVEMRRHHAWLLPWAVLAQTPMPLGEVTQGQVRMAQVRCPLLNDGELVSDSAGRCRV